MTYDEWMDDLGVPVDKRRVMKTWCPSSFCAPIGVRPFIEKIKKENINGIDAMAESLLGVGLKIHSDGSIECTTCAWTDVGLQRLLLEDGSLESWPDYWRRNQGTLIRTLQFQHKTLLSCIRVQQVRNEWSQRGWVAVFLDGFSDEARFSYPVYENGILLPSSQTQLHPTSLVMSKASVHQRFHSSSGGEQQMMGDSYNIQLTWRNLFQLPNMPEAFGLNPHVLKQLLDIKGTRLKFSAAPELLSNYDKKFDIPTGDEEWEIPFEENFITQTYGVRVKGHCSLRFGDKDFLFIREELTRQLEEYMGVTLSLRDIDDDNAIATCWICTEDERVGCKDFWVDLPCCGQALCVSCFDNCTRIDELPLRLFPQCPFCATELDAEKMLNRFQDEDAVLRGDRLVYLQNHVVNPIINPNGLVHDAPEFCTAKDAKNLSRSHRFSSCSECDGVIATRRNCAARLDDLPSVCTPCMNKFPTELNIKPCPTCSNLIERIDGCNNVQCTCGESMCWVCGSAVSNHDPEHFIHGYFGYTCINGHASDFLQARDFLQERDNFRAQGRNQYPQYGGRFFQATRKKSKWQKTSTSTTSSSDVRES